jgi:very-short-patch-repair endonuclease
MPRPYRKPKVRTLTSGLASGVVGDRSVTSVGAILRHGSRIQQRVRTLRANPTPAEKQLRHILNRLYAGKLRGKFICQWGFRGWVLDFYFPEQRLGIEVDGGYHLDPKQRVLDAAKTKGCEESGITIVRLTNREVTGPESVILDRLKAGWIRAAQRARSSRG